MSFVDEWNPTDEEIKAWAYTDEECPDQDFELAVGEVGRLPMLCEIIDDPNSMKKKFFLSTLYVIVGDEVRSKDESRIEKMISVLDEVSKGNHVESVTEWILRSKELISDPTLYSYEYWGIGSKFVYGKPSEI